VTLCYLSLIWLQTCLTLALLGSFGMVDWVYAAHWQGSETDAAAPPSSDMNPRHSQAINQAVSTCPRFCVIRGTPDQD
jgi:hypothetical protein